MTTRDFYGVTRRYNLVLKSFSTNLTSVVDYKSKDPAGSVKTGKGKQIASSENGESLQQHPGQADCVFYLNREACILASDCRFHNPKNKGCPVIPTLLILKKALLLNQ
jgi:hypothetical protein